MGTNRASNILHTIYYTQINKPSSRYLVDNFDADFCGRNEFSCDFNVKYMSEYYPVAL